MVSIAAFQAVDPGSIPGRRIIFILIYFRKPRLMPVVYFSLLLKVKRRFGMYSFYHFMQEYISKILGTFKPLPTLN